MSKRMEKLYETHWNAMVTEMATWNKKLMNNNFDVGDENHVYRDKETKDIAH